MLSPVQKWDTSLARFPLCCTTYAVERVAQYMKSAGICWGTFHREVLWICFHVHNSNIWNREGEEVPHVSPQSCHMYLSPPKLSAVDSTIRWSFSVLNAMMLSSTVLGSLSACGWKRFRNHRDTGNWTMPGSFILTFKYTALWPLPHCSLFLSLAVINLFSLMMKRLKKGTFLNVTHFLSAN